MKRKLRSIIAIFAALILFGSVIPAQASGIEIRSKGNIYGTSRGATAPDNVFAIRDLHNLQADFITCQETADATRIPMIYALALKGVTLPENASYNEIAEGIMQIPDEYTWVNEMEGVTYDYHNHIDGSGEKTNDTANCAVYAEQGGCYTEPVCHVHSGSAAAQGGCYTTPVYHIHTGSTTTGGGCYTTSVYHKHTGSTTASGGCYTTPVYHTHSGSAAAQGGCYITPVYHTHTGNSATGGGCYTIPVYHAHTDACYTEQSVACNCSGYSQGEFLGNHEYDGYPIYQCLNCGHQSTDHSSGKCTVSTMTPVLTCGKDDTTIEFYELGCGKTASTIDAYALGCGKTTSTVESYASGCGKTTSTVESYALGCNKTTSTIDAYALSCGKTDNSIEGYALGCNHVENQIVAAHISY